MDVQIQVKYMDRSSSTIAVLGLLLIGIAVCLKQTIEFYDAIGASLSSVFLTAEALLAVIVLGAGVVLFRRKFLRRPGFTRRRRLEAFAHLRRLLAAVWS